MDATSIYLRDGVGTSWGIPGPYYNPQMAGLKNKISFKLSPSPAHLPLSDAVFLITTLRVDLSTLRPDRRGKQPSMYSRRQPVTVFHRTTVSCRYTLRRFHLIRNRAADSPDAKDTRFPSTVSGRYLSKPPSPPSSLRFRSLVRHSAAYLPHIAGVLSPQYLIL